jgi:hypothetical protein
MTVPEMTSGESFAAVERSVEVPTDADTAFRLFTDRIADWWPMASHSVHGDGGTVGFEEGRLVERHGDRTESWGEVRHWDPPQGFAVTWHPGRHPEEATEVAVSFLEEEPGRTRVRLVHTGWERRDAAARESYATGWVAVLQRYVDAAG